MILRLLVTGNRMAIGSRSHGMEKQAGAVLISSINMLNMIHQKLENIRLRLRMDYGLEQELEHPTARSSAYLMAQLFYVKDFSKMAG